MKIPMHWTELKLKPIIDKLMHDNALDNHELQLLKNYLKNWLNHTYLNAKQIEDMKRRTMDISSRLYDYKMRYAYKLLDSAKSQPELEQAINNMISIGIDPF